MSEELSLKSPFDPKAISWRVGSTTKDGSKGMALAYIDARDVMERLDTVLGAENWSDRYEFHGSRTICYLSIKIPNENGSEWVTKADGAGDSDVEAEKGAISDAFKRAAVKWGVGRYLYDVKTPWVELENKRIKPTEMPKLWRALGVAAPDREEHPPELPEASPEPPARKEPAISEEAIKWRNLILANAKLTDLESFVRQPEYLKGVGTLADHEKAYLRQTYAQLKSKMLSVVEVGEGG